MVDVLFLGTGAALPMPGQTNSAYLLRAPGANILIDCGPAIMQQLAYISVSPGDITHVYLTHRHGDHILGFPMLMLWWALSAPKDAPRPTLIGGISTFMALAPLMDIVYGSEFTAIMNACKQISLSETDPSILQLTPNVRLSTWPMKHSTFAPDLGARFEVAGKALAFTGDTAPNDNVRELARDADLLVHDTNFSATLNPEHAAGAFGHSTAQISARDAAASGARHLALVHIDAIYEGKLPILLEEARREYQGRISIPVAGTLFSY